MTTMRIPYGITDFRRFADDDFYYVDKTRFIEQIELSPSFLFLIRPRRFGKSLWLAMMECYYDINARDEFDRLFGKYYIGLHPTRERNSYLILKFNFAEVNPDAGELKTSFEAHASLRFDSFNKKYKHLFGEDYLDGYKQMTNAEERLAYVSEQCRLANLPIYLIIDEYDNFTNVVLSRHGHERYRDLTHGAGFFRFFFNKIKGATTGDNAAVRRMFITGVSPVTLDDVTSGFNIATMITIDSRFNEILGFTGNEVREMLEYYKSEGCWSGDTDKMLAVMREWYDNYCFSKDCCDVKMYNSDMVLYFMDKLIAHGKMPDELVDQNVKTDYGKLRHLIILDKRLNGNFSRIKEIAERGEIASSIETSFPAEQLIETSKFTSLLFYFGILTIDRVEMGKTVLKVPNLTIRQMLFSYIEQGYREAGIFKLKIYELDKLMQQMAYNGDWRPVFEYFASELKAQTSIRDYLEGEKAVQTQHLVYLSMTNYFTIYPERELNKGYADLWLAPNFWVHPTMEYSYVVEFKYLPRGASDEEVTAKLAAARAQLQQYAGDPKLQEQCGTTTLRCIVVVYRAWELAALEETSVLADKEE